MGLIMGQQLENKQSILTDFTERFGKELQRQEEFINSIQNSLNLILDKRLSVSNESDAVREINDISTKLSYLHTEIISNNMSLETIVSHLSEII